MSMYNNDYNNNGRRRGTGWLVISVALVMLIIGGMLGSVLVRGQYDAQKAQTAPAVTEEAEQTKEKGQKEKEPADFTKIPEEIPETKDEKKPALDPDFSFGDVDAAETMDAFSTHVADLVESVEDSVVGICNYTQAMFMDGTAEVAQGSGSGVIISTDGYVVTNYHVVNGASKVTVLFPDNEEVDAQVIGYDSVLDIALLKIEKDGLVAAKLGDSDAVRTGQFAVAIGSPLGAELAGTVTFGTVSAAKRELNLSDGYTVEMIQTDAAINPGNSGGALLNLNGEVIGINARKNSGMTADGAVIEGLGFAIPINQVKPVVEELIQTGTIKRPGLGITCRLIQGYNSRYEVIYGIEVSTVTEGSGADKAGLKEGDIILELDGEPIQSDTAMRAWLYSKKVGDVVELTVQRNGQKMQLQVELMEISVN